MATGDQTDVISRIEAVLPPWFNSFDATPILDGIIAAYAYLGSQIYSESEYVKLQGRISTATDTNLELISNDYFGLNTLPRINAELDDSYRTRILAFIQVLFERSTRKGMYDALNLLTGRPPIILEPTRPYDVGGYSIAGCGYSVSPTTWGSSQVPLQCFIITYSPISSSIKNLAGWNIPFGAYNTGSLLAWTNITSLTNITNANAIYTVINATKMYATRCWTQIRN